ncbi:uncharacterized protein PRCAT00002835001 [Priceomyces carsonii]|uniref:uncharacterized protein n=1 Tax=Priceomyces carsonii TaxID=28549 RepID=UPI002ED79CC7|nr:unnamed protein product [Priceomyces carsonii]
MFSLLMRRDFTIFSKSETIEYDLSVQKNFVDKDQNIEPHANLLILPDELLLKIIDNFNQYEVLKIMEIDKRFYVIGRQKLLRNIYVRDPFEPPFMVNEHRYGDISSYGDIFKLHQNYTIISPLNFAKLINENALDSKLVQKIILRNSKYSETFKEKLHHRFSNKVIYSESFPKQLTLGTNFNGAIQMTPRQFWNIHFHNKYLNYLTEFGICDSLVTIKEDLEMDFPEVPKSVTRLSFKIAHVNAIAKEWLQNLKLCYPNISALEISGDVAGILQSILEVGISGLNIENLTLEFSSRTTLQDVPIEALIKLDCIKKLELSFFSESTSFSMNYFDRSPFLISSLLINLKKLSLWIRSSTGKCFFAFALVNWFLSSLASQSITDIYITSEIDKDLSLFEDGLRHLQYSLQTIVWIGSLLDPYGTYDCMRQINMVTGATNISPNKDDVRSEIIRLAKGRGKRYFKLDLHQVCYQLPNKVSRAADLFKRAVSQLIPNSEHFPKVRFVIINGIHYIINRYDEFSEVILIYD